MRKHASPEVIFYGRTKITESYRDYEFSIDSLESGCKTYYGIDDAGHVFFVSYKRVSDVIYILIRSNTGSEHLVARIPRTVALLGLFTPGPSIKTVLRNLGHQLSKKSLKRFQDESVLRILDLRLSLKTFCVGVVQVGPDDIDEEDALRNETPSPDFNRFINGLGDRISLKGWPQYSGRLDTTNDYTGSQSIYHLTSDSDEVMFQIAPWIPCRSVVDRKRLTGNNVLNILFLQRNDCEFKLNSFISKQTQCIVLVSADGTGYSCKLYHKQGQQYVPYKGPFFFKLDTRTDRETFLHFLISKELACYEGEPFQFLLIRTRQAMYKSLLS